MRYKDLIIPPFPDKKQEDYCEEILSSELCSDLQCSECLFAEANIEVFNEWITEINEVTNESSKM